MNVCVYVKFKESKTASFGISVQLAFPSEVSATECGKYALKIIGKNDSVASALKTSFQGISLFYQLENDTVSFLIKKRNLYNSFPNFLQ